MSYTMTHIYIAENVSKHVKGITDYPTYMLGSVAPDAVHAREDYTPTLKEKSHLFTEGLHWGKVGTLEQAEAWESSIREYYLSHKGSVDYNFLLGYTVHLYSDVYSSMNFFAPFVRAAGEDLAAVKERFVHENFCYNYYLYEEYVKSTDLRSLLTAGKPVTLEGVISADDIKKRVELLFKQEFVERDISDIDSYTVCSHESMKRLIDGSTELVLKRLKELDKDIIDG